MKSTIITKQCSGLIIEMEILLIIWLDEQNQCNMPISLFKLFKKYFHNVFYPYIYTFFYTYIYTY